MLQDKEMVNDALASMKSGLTAYETAITECSNMQLRSTLQQIRNNDENSHWELYKIAETKGFYKSAQMAQDQEIQQVRSQLQG